jgi:hypothetical protein
MRRRAGGIARIGIDHHPAGFGLALLLGAAIVRAKDQPCAGGEATARDPGEEGPTGEVAKFLHGPSCLALTGED